MIKKWFKKTEDQELVDEIRQCVERIQALGRKAEERKITVYLKNGTRKLYIPAYNLRFDEAYRTNQEKF